MLRLTTVVGVARVDRGKQWVRLGAVEFDVPLQTRKLCTGWKFNRVRTETDCVCGRTMYLCFRAIYHPKNTLSFRCSDGASYP